MTNIIEHKETPTVAAQRGVTRLNLGSGPDYRKDYINADIIGGDVKCDLSKFPWPWPDESADEILMMHVLEHLPDTYGTMAEIRRILKPGGKFWGQVPYAFSYSAFSHPQHYRFFTDQSFGILAEQTGFTLVNAKLISFPTNIKSKVRNWIPYRVRYILQGLVLNMFDAVDFELKKPLNSK